MKKLVSIKGVIDNIKQSVNTPSPPGMGGCGSGSGPVKLEQELIENLSKEQFTAEVAMTHGFPFKATSMAFDPLQRLLAIGTRHGQVKIFGKPGIDAEFKHENDAAVIQMLFINNTGKLLTACTDDTINMWDLTQKEPELCHTLKLNKERLTVMSLEFQDKWLYLGTERGNVLILNLDTFSLSGYVINWNGCIPPLEKNHPGPVSQIAVNPADTSKLLIGFRTGLICLWDLASKKGEQRYIHNQVLYSICWHLEGRQFIASYGDGSLITWNIKPQVPNKPQMANKPQNVQFPHGKKNKESGTMQICDPIDKVLWRVTRASGENYIVFSGGLPTDVTGVTPSITVMQGKSTTLLEMENTVLDFLLVTDTPYSSDYQDPEAIIVMLANDIVAIDCKSSGYPCFKNPYSMDFNESPVTFCKYLVDCPGDLIPALYMVGSKVKKEAAGRGFSNGDWPVNGGIDCGTEACSYTELLITGHTDGSVRFWDCSSTSMQSLYRLKTAKYFERTKKGTIDGLTDDPYSVSQIAICEESRELAVAGAAGQVLFFRFYKKEQQTETKSMEIPIVYEVTANHQSKQQNQHQNSDASPQQQHFEFPTPKPLLNVASQSAAYTDPVDGFNFDKPQYEYFCPLRWRAGSQRKSPGYHAELACFTPWVNNEPPTAISCLTVNSNYGLMAYGNGSGLVVVDVVQFVCLLNMGTADLYGCNDPFQRLPKSPKHLDAMAGAEIVRVDLGSYSQVNADQPQGQGQGQGQTAPPATSSSGPANKAIERVKSPDSRKLKKALSLADDPPSSLGATDKAAGNKSRSSSASSLDQLVSVEGVTALHFADTFTSKNDFSSLNASLYVGTTLGSFIAIVIHLPEKGDARHNEPVVVSPSGSIYRLRGPVLCLAFLDCSAGSLLARGEPAENVKVPAKVSLASGHAPSLSAMSSLQSSAGSHDDKSPPSSTGTAGSGDQQIAVVCTEKCAGVFALPSQKQMYSQSVNESAHVIVAEVINFGGPKFTPCLVAYTSDGMIKCYSLPTLRPMLDMYFMMNSPKVSQTFTFSNFGHGLYFSNDNEVQKMTVSADFMRQLPDMRGAVFQDNIAMPEPPKQGFLKGLFGGGPKPLDREELFGESAGKLSSQMATYTQGPNMAPLQGKSGNTTNEVAKAKISLMERGEKLNELEEKAEMLANESKQYATNARTLMMKEKNRKWYQL